MRIALAQINTTVGDLKGNQSKILSSIYKAEEQGAEVIVFPELSVTGYPPEDLLLKTHFVLDNIKVIEQLAKQIKRIMAIIGFVDRDKKGNLYNAAAIIANKKIKAVYHKNELPNYGVFDEKRYFKRGEKAPVFAHRGIIFGVNICEDIWIEKSAWQSQAKQGARLLINLSSSPYDMGKLAAREELLRKRAKATKAFIAYVNLVAGQDELIFDGCSVVINPKGKMVASGAEFEEDVVVVDIDVPREKNKSKLRSLINVASSLTADKEEHIKPRLSPCSSVNERIYKALVLGTRDYVRKNGFKKVLIGLSGGVDSALVAAIAVDAIGKENVIGVTMPSKFSSKGTRRDAKQVAENLGMAILEFPIDAVLDGYLDLLSGAFSGLKTDIAEENIQARIRGNILMALSNKFGWLVLTTGNKSEMAVGYCTLYGDMSGGFAVIKDVPKTKVYELARLKNRKEGKAVIPLSVIERAPSAELRHNQKDQDSLPPYETLDKILIEYVEKHHSLKKITEGHSAVTAKEVVNMVDRNEYKRRQAPPGIKITARAFGKDWRLPITNKYKEYAE